MYDPQGERVDRISDSMKRVFRASQNIRTLQGVRSSLDPQHSCHPTALRVAQGAKI